ncbi:S8 family serine peptidase [Deferrisoma sp.]
MNRRSLLRAVTAASLGATLFLAPPSLAGPQPRPVPGRILVQAKAGAPDAAVQAAVQAHGGRVKAKIRGIRAHVVEVPPQAQEAVLQALRHNPHVSFAEPDMAVPPEGVPDDPRYPSQWHLPAVGAPPAWDTSRGEDVVIAVLDTGVDGGHPDLAGRMVPGWNFYDQNADTSDVHGHGTWVAGTAAATLGNALGVAGLAGRASVMPVRIAGPDGWAYWSTVAQGITWAADHGARVANVSYNGVAGSSTVQSAARYLRGKGGLVVVAAGNSGGREAYADSPDLLAVSATTASDARASFSSYGAYVDLAAPGTSILTTARGGGYQTVQGTSFASPLVAAAAALLWSVNPALAPSDVETILFQTAADLGDPGWDEWYGHGRLDAAAAVELALSADPVDTQAPWVSIASPTGGTVAGTVEVAVEAGDNVGVTRVDLRVNGQLLASDETGSYRFAWDTAAEPEGTATLVAEAWDAAGNRAASQPVTVTVDNQPDPPDTTPPSVTLLQPADGTTVGRKVSIEARASDDRSVRLLEVRVDGHVLCATNLTTLTCNWNTRKASPGPHAIEARALDPAGNEGLASVTVLVPDSGSGTGGKGRRKKR